MEPIGSHTLTLDGELLMSTAMEQHVRLLEFLEAAEGQPGDDSWKRVVLDLNPLTSLDACGCQLLATFLRSLARRGLSVCEMRLDEGLRKKIQILGFNDELLTGCHA